MNFKTPTAPIKTHSAVLLQQISQAMFVDQHRLRRRLQHITDKSATDESAWLQLELQIQKSVDLRNQRAAQIPTVTIGESLPIAQAASEIIQAIQQNPVVIIAGETGSGKTTQLPQLCLAAGYGIAGMIGCTQPRRVAARTVAQRVAQELTTQLGYLVGFQVRFTEQVHERTLIKFMTDGIMLAEIQSDPWLSRYDTIIVDEAHERSINIDFLLGYLKNLSHKRRDLKIIITSATIDTERFSRHFSTAPIIHVAGRTYPVETRWRPAELLETREKDISSHILSVVNEITQHDPLGDILIFFPGEREIRDVHLALERQRYRETEIVPLYARLAWRDQSRVFQPGPQRRVVLATNVAETSLTVPRIRYVIDTGIARISRFSHRHKVQRLHIEPISQASANQRQGRCGRIGPGICYRLYSAEDFAARPAYTEPELLRSSLASVILRLLHLRIGGIESFPFVERPTDRAIQDGYQQLIELNAITEDRKHLTPVGKQLVRLPIDVKLGRMCLAAHELDVLREVLIITAFLSIQDPRERPADAREAADNAHRLHADAQSDFTSILKLWADYEQTHQALKQSALRDWCQKHFLSFTRMREWRELHRQLLLLSQEMQWLLSKEAATYENLHLALLSGLPTQVARRNEKNQYIGTRSRKYSIFPGSFVAKKPPLWLLSATLLDTQRLYALTNARIEPEWIEKQVPHLLKRRHFDPHWSCKQGRVLGFESVTLFGLVLVDKRRISYERIDPAASREVFIRHALLTGEINCKTTFVQHNQLVLEQARQEEHKQRRQGLIKTEDELYNWLSARLPENICTSIALDAWYKKLNSAQKKQLEWQLDEVLITEVISKNAFPESLTFNQHHLQLQYHFTPQKETDGVTLILPLFLLNTLNENYLSWLVPGLLREKVIALIRALPKNLRRNFVPVPDFANAFIQAQSDITSKQHLNAALSQWLEKVSGVPVATDIWNHEEIPSYLFFNLRLIDAKQKLIAESRNLSILQQQYGAHAHAQFAQATRMPVSQIISDTWDFDDLPEVITTESGLTGFPACTDQRTHITIQIFEQEASAQQAHVFGVWRLYQLSLASEAKKIAKQISISNTTALIYSTIDSPEQLRQDIANTALMHTLGTPDLYVRQQDIFLSTMQRLKKEWFAVAMSYAKAIENILPLYADTVKQLKSIPTRFSKISQNDLNDQLQHLIYRGFVQHTHLSQLQEIPRYLQGMLHRLSKLQQDPSKDQQRLSELDVFLKFYAAQLTQIAHSYFYLKTYILCNPKYQAIDQFRWSIEELRMQKFAQQLKVKGAISDKKLTQMMQQF